MVIVRHTEMDNYKIISIIVGSILLQLIVVVGALGIYHLTMQGKYYDLRGIQVPTQCEKIDQVILYPNRESVAIVCELEAGK